MRTLTKSLSTMIDTDMSEEMTTYTSETVLTQAATSILAQANERPSQVLRYYSSLRFMVI